MSTEQVIVSKSILRWEAMENDSNPEMETDPRISFVSHYIIDDTLRIEEEFRIEFAQAIGRTGDERAILEYSLISKCFCNDNSYLSATNRPENPVRAFKEAWSEYAAAEGKVIKR